MAETAAPIGSEKFQEMQKKAVEEQMAARKKVIAEQMQKQRAHIESALSQVKRRIAVYSGKGGVGKTTVAINLAALLAKRGFRVGLLDADIDCPNVAKLLGLSSVLRINEESKVIPVTKYGINVVSMASLPGNDDDNPTVWRGPLVTKALMQFLGGVVWGKLDYLFIDMPPGTSDIPLTLLQYTKLDGFIIVTSPQKVSELDARKSGRMVENLKGRLLGVVENFSGEMFGSGAGKRAAKALKVPLLGKITLNRAIRERADRGVPAVLKDKVAEEEFSALLAALEAQFRD